MDDETSFELNARIAQLESIIDLLAHRNKELERDVEALKQIIEGLLKVYAQD